MVAFEDDVEVMNSMQKPRKITVRGTDGVRYPFLVKPKDDLRKDARLMEFNSIINKLLKKDVESSRRQLCMGPTIFNAHVKIFGRIQWCL
jgi:serine/threonine-protein kinase ATR